MAWVAPKGGIGVTVVASGTSVLVLPQAMPDGSRIVCARLVESCARSELKTGASAPPNTSGWKKGTLKESANFPIDGRARGKITQELDDENVVVDFEYVTTIVARRAVRTR